MLLCKNSPYGQRRPASLFDMEADQTIVNRAPERSPENIVQLLFMNNRANSRGGEQTKTNSRGGEQTVGLEQPPGTAKTLFDECVDQIWILECTSDDHHT